MKITSVVEPQTGAPDRFRTPLYTIAEAARYLAVPERTFANWSRDALTRHTGRSQLRHAVVSALPKARSTDPRIPFVGLGEGLVLAAWRKAHVPLQRIRPALERLRLEMGLEHALASRRLFTDGVEVLFDYAKHGEDEAAASAARDLVTVRSGQRVFEEVVHDYLRRLEFNELDGYVALIHLPAYETADVVVDPQRGFGQPIFAESGVRIEDAISLFRAGEPIDVVSAEFGIAREQLEDAIRVALTA